MSEAFIPGSSAAAVNDARQQWHLAYRRADIGQGISMAYRELGSGEPVVLIHGWPQHSQMWHSIAPRIGERYHVIAPDLRGSGGTTVKGPYDKAAMAGDVLRMMDLLQIGQARVVGYDLGAGVAYDLAARHPDRVRSLAFMEFGLPGFGYEHEMTAKADWHPGSNWHLSFFTVPDVAQWAFQGRERQFLGWIFGHIAMNPGAVSAEDFELYVRLLERPGSLRAGIEYYASVWQDSESNKALAERPLAMPVLGVGGEASAAGWVAEGLKSVASNVRGFVIPGAGHWLGDENPQAVADVLLDFFAEAEAPDAAA
ncbi:MAG TPA: alpha/beta hydrolase [Allosphingosinicella sp.]|nr:alpha/beta hydrolase [Allosphingosinicella sp.]